MSQENIDRHILPPAADIVGQRSGINEITDKYDLDEEQRQKALLVNGALQNAIFNSANFSSIATDAQGIIQIFNAGAERMLGYTAVEVMNRMRPFDIYEQTFIRKDGSRLPAIVSVTALRDGKKIIIGYLLVATRNKLAELEQNRHHLEQRVCSCTAELAQAKEAAESTATAGALRPEAKEFP